MNQMATLREWKISGVSSMIRDLSLISNTPDELESAIANGVVPVPPKSLAAIRVKQEGRMRLNVGDIVLYRILTMGAYSDVETGWGDRVPIVVGNAYLGVICNRCSSRLVTARLPTVSLPLREWDLQLVAQAGGIGYATGCARGTAGMLRPSDVEVLGVLVGPGGKALNLGTGVLLPIERRSWVPTVLVVGTATDVGKTTCACGVLRELSRSHVCAAIKASGTGWFEDSLEHSRSGAALTLNFTFAGLPTTYYLESPQYLEAMSRVVGWASAPADIPTSALMPAMRGQRVARPEWLVVEHGGDLIEAGVPAYLGSEELMRGTQAVVLCSESAVAVIGALEVLRAQLSASHCRPPIYASMPLGNADGFLSRVEPLLAEGALAGVLDVAKPVLTDPKRRRVEYTEQYESVLSPAEFVRHVSISMGRS